MMTFKSFPKEKKSRSPRYLGALVLLAIVSSTSFFAMQSSSSHDSFWGASIGILESDTPADLFRKSFRLDFPDLHLQTVVDSDRGGLFSDEESLCGPVDGVRLVSCVPWTEVYTSVANQYGVTRNEIEEKAFQVSSFAISRGDSGYLGHLTLVSLASGPAEILTPEAEGLN